MNIRELRAGNIVIYEACYFMVLDINTSQKPFLVVKPVNHDWKNDKCGINEVEGVPIDDDILRKNGFVPLNNIAPNTLWIKELGGNRFIRYNSRVQYMEFEETVSFQRVPWAVRFLHQMQNACTDYGLELDFKP